MLRLLLLVVLVGCGGGAMYDVRLINRTDHTLEAVYVYPTAAHDRGASRAKLAPNAEAVLKIAAGNVDVFAVMEKIKVDQFRSDTITATGTLELRAPSLVIFHDSTARPAELSQPNTFGIAFRKAPPPAGQPDQAQPEPPQPEAP